LIIDGQGKIQKVILSIGGYLRIGDKLTAVDYDDLQSQSQRFNLSPVLKHYYDNPYTPDTRF